MRFPKLLLFLAMAAVAALPGVALAKDGPTPKSEPHFDHVFVIVEENEESPSIIGNANPPTINQLAQAYGLATNYYGVIHPSEGNYVAMVGGNAYGVTDDNPYTTHQFSNPSLVDQFEGAGLAWKGYFQTMPTAGFTGTCYPSSSQCLYASKHNGFVNFSHVTGSPAEMAKLVPDNQLATDLASGDVPNFSFIVPDQCHDMHGIGSLCPDNQTNIKVADQYLSDTVSAIMSSKIWNQGHNAIVVTFDEGTSNTGCCDANPGGGRVVTIVATNHKPSAMQDATPYNHYSLVATIEQAFGLGCIQFTCDTANVTPMDALFGLHQVP